VKVAEFRG